MRKEIEINGCVEIPCEITTDEFADAFIAKNAYKAYSLASPYYSALYNHEAFYNRMVEVYRDEFLPVLEWYIDTGIQQLSDSIAAATQLDQLRWGYMYQYTYSTGLFLPTDAESILAYLRTRVAFLNRAWLGGEEYCTLQYPHPDSGAYCNISVPKGSVLDESYLERLGVEQNVWVLRDTDTMFDPTEPIMEDTILANKPVVPEETVPEQTEEAPVIREPFTIQEKVAVVSLLLLTALFLCFLITDIRRTSKERSRTDEHSKSVSS